MYFIAHVEVWDEDKHDFVEESILFSAHNYPDATQIIVDMFGKDIERITLLEAITDMSAISLDSEGIAEKLIRKQPANGF